MFNVILVVSFFLILKYVPSGFAFGFFMLFFSFIIGIKVSGSTSNKTSNIMVLKSLSILGKSVLAILSVSIAISALMGFLKGFYPDYTLFNFIFSAENNIKLTAGEIKGQEKEIAINGALLLLAFIPCISAILSGSKLRKTLHEHK